MEKKIYEKPATTVIEMTPTKIICASNGNPMLPGGMVRGIELAFS